MAMLLEILIFHYLKVFLQFVIFPLVSIFRV